MLALVDVVHTLFLLRINYFSLLPKIQCNVWCDEIVSTLNFFPPSQHLMPDKCLSFRLPLQKLSKKFICGSCKCTSATVLLA